jgi:hypothetical protein
MVHFGIAYFILDRCFFRLAYALVQVDEREEAVLSQQVATQQTKIADRIQYNEQDWIILQKRLLSECPAGIKPILTYEPAESVVRTDPTPAEVEEMHELLQPALVELIKRKR